MITKEKEPMNSPAIPGKDSMLEHVRQQFITWRETKKHRERIPKTLWRAAVDLVNSGEYSLHKIGKTLRLNQADLKKQVSKNLPGPAFLEPAFIELDQPSVSVSECIIELENVSGAKMRMCFRGQADPALVELGRSFWRKPA